MNALKEFEDLIKAPAKPSQMTKAELAQEKGKLELHIVALKRKLATKNARMEVGIVREAIRVHYLSRQTMNRNLGLAEHQFSIMERDVAISLQDSSGNSQSPDWTANHLQFGLAGFYNAALPSPSSEEELASVIEAAALKHLEATLQDECERLTQVDEALAKN